MARGRRLTPTARVRILSAVLVLVVVVVQVMIWRVAGTPAAHHLNVSLLAALAVLFALVERFNVTFPVRRGTHSMSLSEIPLILALLMIHPVLLVPVRLVGALAGLALLRGQRGSKLLFNTALYLIQAAVAAVVFDVCHGTADPYGPLGWLAAYAAAFAADLVSIVLVTAVIAIHDDSQEWRRLLTADVQQLFQMPLVAVTTTLALVTALLVRQEGYAALLLAVLAFAAQRVFHRYAQQTTTHQQVENLYRFTGSLDGLTSADEVARTVLGQARDLLRAQEAALMVTGPEDGEPVLMRLHGPEDCEVVPVTLALQWWMPARAGEPVLWPGAIAVPLRLGQTVGVLMVKGSLSDSEYFTAEHLQLMQAVSAHAGAALSEARLLERLQHIASHDPLTGLPNR
ncbi:GAF domain-containing protein [Actinoplanes sp. L3-i22]|uniref:GAF domain-containing protein n=1 Tax=Actinoplanes sp. L3-i22 TaxID=2836373 RepID=UPI001C74E6BC|nr:GAF domain-containing protein [Actinoplanes sp. L3-i22]BCY11472.1 hypothetical protein L3i22_065600 [Actinoplanes sp. L3-i22]